MAMGEWPHCPNGCGPLEPEQEVTFTDEGVPRGERETLSGFSCPDCGYEMEEKDD